MSEIYMQGDKIYYCGSRFRDRLGSKPGWLHAPVLNQPGTWIVEFPGSRKEKDHSDSDDYVLSEQVFSHWRKEMDKETEKKQEGPEVQPRRRRTSEEE